MRIGLAFLLSVALFACGDDEPRGGADAGLPDGAVAPSCTDEMQNFGETDVDCGGPNCMPCASGEACLVFSDCRSEVCAGGVCAGGRCDDGIQNGLETDVDCGGEECEGCLGGAACNGPGGGR